MINYKFKNLKIIPVPIGGILLMYNTSNPAELYPGTTWELLPENKLLKTGNTPLQQGGSNSLKLSKANLPAEKLQINSFQLGKGTQEITGAIGYNVGLNMSGAFYAKNGIQTVNGANHSGSSNTMFQASRTWTGMSTSATPYTQNMGSGTPLTINPEHITIRAWKRLT